MNCTGRRLSAFLVAAALVLCAPQVLGDTFPSHAIRLVIPYPPGGISDKMLRPIAIKMSEGLHVPIVIDNRPGANGNIGTEIVVKSPPDGYTLVMGSTSSLPMNAAISKLPFDPINDLAPVTGFAYAPQVLTVSLKVPATNVKELIALAKANPGTITYGTPGIGSSPHFAAAMFAAQTGIKLLHVPYKGGAPATIALLSGEIMMNFDSIGSAAPYIKAGRIRALGLAAPQRSPAAPDIPTIAESGVPGFEVGTLFALFAPAGTPKDVIAKLHDEMVRVLALPEIRENMLNVGTEPVATSPEDLGNTMKSDMGKWAKVASDANIHGE